MTLSEIRHTASSLSNLSLQYNIPVQYMVAGLVGDGFFSEDEGDEVVQEFFDTYDL